jgi:hypothetical protein
MKLIKYYENIPFIEYPKWWSEFEVQAALWSKLKAEGLDVRGCVKSRTIDFGKRPRVYFDLVVFSAHRTPIVIIECKNRKQRIRRLGSRQQRRYSAFDIPLLVCANQDDIDPVAQEVMQLVCEFEQA